MRYAPLSLVAVVVTAGAARAQNAPASKPMSSDWHGSYGAGALVRPWYAGSDVYRVQPFPFLQVEYKGRVVAGVLNSGTLGVGSYLVRKPNLSLQMDLTASEMRRESYGNGLAGMGNRKTSAVLGTSATYSWKFVGATASVASGLGGDDGTSGAVGLGVQGGFAERWMAGITTNASFGDTKNMAFSFGIDERQAAVRRRLIEKGDSRLTPSDGRSYAPGSGLKQVSTGVTLGYMVTQRTSVTAFGSSSELSHRAAMSPLVKERNSMTGGLMVTRSF